MVENNASGQLASLIKQHVPEASGKLYHHLKYDGNPFLPAEIYHACKEMFVWQR